MKYVVEFPSVRLACVYRWVVEADSESDALLKKARELMGVRVAEDGEVDSLTEYHRASNVSGADF